MSSLLLPGCNTPQGSTSSNSAWPYSVVIHLPQTYQYGPMFCTSLVPVAAAIKKQGASNSIDLSDTNRLTELCCLLPGRYGEEALPKASAGLGPLRGGQSFRSECLFLV